MKKTLLIPFLLIALSISAQHTGVSVNKTGTSQNPAESTKVDSLSKYFNWYNLAPENGYQGASVEKAYNELLKDRKPVKKVVVAVIDGGVDIDHKDLQGKIWVNRDEIPGNGVDDDANGYTDDINGWNFIGGADGTNVEYENLEFVRIIKELKPRFANITDPSQLPASDTALYAIYQKCNEEYESKHGMYAGIKDNVEALDERLKRPTEVIQKYLKKDTFTLDDLKNIKTDNELVKQSKDMLMKYYKKGFTNEMLKEFKKEINQNLNFRLNLDYDARATIVKDNPLDMNDRFYGNNDVQGGSPFHGTFVSGIIAADRYNNYGVMGVASNVEIMVLRAVPNGDERDKDIALSVRYAVDNGANIINMSFGKYYSLRSEFMDDAFRYADDHNVLVIHSAGNEGSNIDYVKNYPSSRFKDGGVAKNMITVGASTYEEGKRLPASFSNYGKQNVDVFAPGVDLIGIAPENKFDQGDGTSFSGPVVSGVAALVWSYFPNLSASDLKAILLSTVDTYPDLKVVKPATRKDKAMFSDLSATGGTINAYRAIQEALKKQLTD